MARKNLPDLSAQLERVRVGYEKARAKATKPRTPARPATVQAHRNVRGALMLGQALMGLSPKRTK